MDNQPSRPGDGPRYAFNHEPLADVMMNFRVVPVVALLFFSSSTCRAAKYFQRSTPNGKTFTVKQLEGGRLKFTITRDPADTTQPNDRNLVIRRSGYLRILEDDREVFAAQIAPKKNNAGNLVYTFTLSEDLAANAVFRLSEIEDYKWGGGYLGGGWITEYALPTVPGFNERRTRSPMIGRLRNQSVHPSPQADLGSVETDPFWPGDL